MLCQQCKKYPATVSYMEIVNGKKFEIHLCGECYADLYGEANSKAGGGFWAGLLNSRVHQAKACPVCGTTYADYENSGLLGCAGCYDVFKDELLPDIRRIHGKVNHVGKVGKNVDELGLHRRLGYLQEQLEAALRDKRYNDAGALNRQIDAIKKQIDGGENNG